MTHDQEDMLNMLENLLSVTSNAVSTPNVMNSDEREVWESIAAKVADIRDGEDV